MSVLCVTVDVDGEAGLPDGGRAFGERLTSRSERAYGLHRGLPRVLDVLDELACVGTFYVPGVTALRYPHEVASILERGHELGHHGHTHRRPDTLTPDEQRAEIELGLEALARFDVAPLGYRAPGWELTPVTLAALDEYGFAWDSSLMGDDEPYVLPARAGTIVELPVHWSLDDAPYYAASPCGGGILEVWSRAVSLAASEGRTVTLTLHPEILGRPERVPVLRDVLGLAGERGMVVRAHGAVATPPRPAGQPG